MLNFLKELKRQSVLSAIVTILLGLILILAPNGMIALVLGLIGWVLIVTGAISLISFVVNRTVYSDYGQLILGVVQLLFGGWIVRNPSGIVALTANIVGIIVLIHAVKDLQYAFEAHRVGAANWWLAAVTGGVTLLLSLAVLLNPVRSAVTLVTFAGVCLIVDGVSDLLVLRRLDRYL